ncbi:MAG: biopolymer transporter ExbD [Betaproteobacteria bacterium]|nr:biopolymer transporter ExbD [Betaproteobacteria bacterium]
MAMGSLSDSEDDFNPEINTTPLVDVMLVLLIIFMITIPVMNHAVKIDLPHARNQPDEIKPDNINISVDADAKIYWNTEEVTMPELQARIDEAAHRQPQPEVHIRGARTVAYEKVAQVMAAVQHGGIQKVGFPLDPTMQ